MSVHTENLGQLFLLAIKGDSVTAAEKMIVRKMQPAGVTLFTRNLRSVDQIIKLNNELISLFESHVPIIAIDQEGGLKERLPVPPFTHWPGNELLGNLFEATGSDHLTIMQFEAIGKELAALGINLNFAPVMDVPSQTKKSFMTGRAFSSNPDIAASLCIAALKGMATAGIVGCAKHFPGHGDTQVDSHLQLPQIDKSLFKLEHSDLVPFARTIEAGVPVVMSSHIIFPELDASVPATLSPALLSRLLKGKLKFRGLILTDDMNMMAITSNYGLLDAARKSLEAGAHIRLYCEGVDHGYEVWENFQGICGKEAAFADSCASLANEVVAWKKKHLANRPMPSIDAARVVTSSRKHREIASEIAKQAEQNKIL
jgi:beta-N-acetylhexosaminidase